MGRRIRVVVRTRPGEGGGQCVRAGSSARSGGSEVIVADPSGTHASSIPREFLVDAVVPPESTNAEVFRSLVLERIRSSVDEPDTSCFLAYGHTCSGKTHTIAGAGAEPGLLSLAAQAVLDAHGVAEVAMLEVYGEAVHDLLARGERRVVRRRCGPDGPVILVEHMTTCSLTTMEEWAAVAEFGMQTRRTAPTERNARSSRSHAIFTIKSRGFRLCLVDLAGSERQTVFSPQLNKESIAINKSLSRLSTVLEALSTARRRADGSASYVNFRDTTLTVLLQRYLSGASMTTFLACIHPDTQFYHETLSTMRYTQRLKRINTKAAPRQVSEDMSLFRPPEQQDLLAELVRLRRIVDQQQQQQEKLHRTLQHSSSSPSSNAPDGTHKAPEGAGEHARLYENGNEADEVERARYARRHRGNSSLISPPVDAVLAHRQRQRLLRSKDTKRVAGWLLSRILGELTELSVGFDDYFDPYLPPTVQVIGYVSLMACLPPRSADEAFARLALLDVGDIAMGLSMLDAGIPACVGLHRLQCRASDAWEAHEYDDANRVFVLAVFEVGDGLVEPMDGSPDAFECCGGLLALEPLVPLAVVLCTPPDAGDDLKESILRYIVTLQGEQGEALESSTASDTLSGDLSPSGEEDEVTESANELAQEVERQAHDKALICSPFREPSHADSCARMPPHQGSRFAISPSFSDSTDSVSESVPQTSGESDEPAAAQRKHRSLLTEDVGALCSGPEDNTQTSEEFDASEPIAIDTALNDDEGPIESIKSNETSVHSEGGRPIETQNGKLQDMTRSSTCSSTDLDDRDSSEWRAALLAKGVRIDVSEQPLAPKPMPQQQPQQLPKRHSWGHAVSVHHALEEQKESRTRKSRRARSKKRLALSNGCQSCTML